MNPNLLAASSSSARKCRLAKEEERPIVKEAHEATSSSSAWKCRLLEEEMWRFAEEEDRLAFKEAREQLSALEKHFKDLHENVSRKRAAKRGGLAYQTKLFEQLICTKDQADIKEM
ncbi:hypothetical protein L7F22_059840 [Adiantum nelumboides]|nr:hypothetical protein [Adiantum nelumboides]